MKKLDYILFFKDGNEQRACVVYKDGTKKLVDNKKGVNIICNLMAENNQTLDELSKSNIFRTSTLKKMETDYSEILDLVENENPIKRAVRKLWKRKLIKTIAITAAIALSGGAGYMLGRNSAPKNAIISDKTPDIDGFKFGEDDTDFDNNNNNNNNNDKDVNNDYTSKYPNINEIKDNDTQEKKKKKKKEKKKLPHNSKKSESSAKPSQTPINTEVPVVTADPSQTPVNTEVPVMTAVPSQTPINTEVPVETAVPSQTPVNTEVPVMTAAPSQTPINTEVPVVTADPSQTPINTEVPVPTSTPDVVSGDAVEPEITSSPAPTSTPDVVSGGAVEPEITATPVPTSTEIPSTTTEPTTTPEVTSTPTPNGGIVSGSAVAMQLNSLSINDIMVNYIIYSLESQDTNDVGYSKVLKI